MDFILISLEWLVDFAHKTGYVGVFLMTFLESTFLPIPSEITMIPVGYLIYQGEMSMWAVILTSILGTVLGSLLSYYIAYRYGRKLLLDYGSYLFMNDEKLAKIEKFFNKHGAISTFTGRLIPGLRHFISFPAGLAKMNLASFSLFTALGGGFWMTTLLFVGYFIGRNEEKIHEILSIVSTVFIAFAIILVAYYIYKQQIKNKTNVDQ
ncbi:DedA family protein [Rickettsiales endosymbiont of Stachyamoeba lipophora]|uniref:DedA family protein n=1 Tax=Rickettsiales endosymbiont of Stachyamoeba lipophora TaxID=2486578 RepID=UPI000F6458E0|nr:DedA family protein [Rickettsiales endosymbiont of Stachyamoeba lipophora]AZL15571.1 DedA family protein [Rickettsiales endosymbiont of Stachyamoeba lipophora]